MKIRKLGLLAPAGQVKAQSLPTAEQITQRLGLEVRLDRSQILSSAATREQGKPKAEHWHSLLADSTVDALWAVRGGSGSIHALSQIYEHQSYRHSHKALFGFSDLTTLLNYQAEHTKAPTFHAPNLLWLMRADQIEVDAFLHRLSGDWSGELAGELNPQLISLHAGECEGELYGGNLCVLASLCGTPWSVSFRDRIAFFEDVNEPPYKLERMLAQLYYAGALRGVRGVVLGSFRQPSGAVADRKPSANGEAPTELSTDILSEIFMPYFGHMDIPVLAHFPAGHGQQNRILPFGQTLTLRTSPPSLQVSEYTAV